MDSLDAARLLSGPVRLPSVALPIICYYRGCFSNLFQAGTWLDLFGPLRNSFPSLATLLLTTTTSNDLFLTATTSNLLKLTTLFKTTALLLS